MKSPRTVSKDLRRRKRQSPRGSGSGASLSPPSLLRRSGGLRSRKGTDPILRNPIRWRKVKAFSYRLPRKSITVPTYWYQRKGKTIRVDSYTYVRKPRTVHVEAYKVRRWVGKRKEPKEGLLPRPEPPKKLGIPSKPPKAKRLAPKEPPLEYGAIEERERYGWEPSAHFIKRKLRRIEREGFILLERNPIYHSKGLEGREYVEKSLKFLYSRKINPFKLRGLFLLLRSWHIVVFPRKKPKKYVLWVRHDALGKVRDFGEKGLFSAGTTDFNTILQYVHDQISAVQEDVAEMEEGYAEYRGLLCFTAYLHKEERPQYLGPREASRRTRKAWPTRRRLYGRSGKRRSPKAPVRPLKKYRRKRGSSR